MIRFLIIVVFISQPLIGLSVEMLKPIELLAVNNGSKDNGNQLFTNDQKFYTEPAIDQLPILNHSETEYQTPPENYLFHFSQSFVSNGVRLNKIPKTILKQSKTENKLSSGKQFIKLRVFRI